MAEKPKMILVMRHAEKPADPLNPDLTATGKRRARQLATYVPKTFGKPDFIFVAAISRHSARPYQTVQPLSKSIKVAIDAEIADNDYGVLAQELLTKKNDTPARASWCAGIMATWPVLDANAHRWRRRVLRVPPIPGIDTVFNLILAILELRACKAHSSATGPRAVPDRLAGYRESGGITLAVRSHALHYRDKTEES